MKYTSNAEAVAKAANRAVYEVLGDFARDAVAKAKANAPVGKTGRVKDSIGCRFSTGKAYVGSTWYIARFQELGTVHQKAKPFLKPAVMSAYPKVKANLKSKLENA